MIGYSKRYRVDVELAPVTFNRLSHELAEKKLNELFDFVNFGSHFASFSLFLESNNNYAKIVHGRKTMLSI